MSRVPDSIEAPGVRDALQLVFARILEDQAGSGCQVSDRRGHQDLRGSGERHDPRSSVHGDAVDVLAFSLDLARMDTRTDLDPDRTSSLGDRGRTPHGPSGAIERRKEPVTSCVDLDTVETLKLVPDQLVVLRQKLAPPGVSQKSGSLRRPHDVREHHGRKRGVERRGRGGCRW
jgi:hypothetical protein